MTADDIIRSLNLRPHPRERGYFRESYRSSEQVSWEALPARYTGKRSFSTAIYFLLTCDGFSEIHRLRSDETFHFYFGSTIELLLLYTDFKGEVIRLGADLGAGDVPQFTVPAGCWQGMRTTGKFALLGCTVSPGFEFSDYESGNREDLIRKYPDFADRIKNLTDPS